MAKAAVVIGFAVATFDSAIDSTTSDPFTEDDERLLEFVNAEVSKILV